MSYAIHPFSGDCHVSFIFSGNVSKAGQVGSVDFIVSMVNFSTFQLFLAIYNDITGMGSCRARRCVRRGHGGWLKNARF